MEHDGVDVAVLLGLGARGPLGRHVLVVDASGVFLVDILVVPVPGSAEDDAEVLVDGVGHPEDALATLGADVVGLGPRGPLFAGAAVQPEGRDDLARHAEDVPALVHSRRLEEVQDLDQPRLRRVQPGQARLRVGELLGGAEETVALS